MADTLIEVKDLKKYFKVSKGILHAVDGISFSIERGRTLGIVGESGCGKSTLGRCVIRLIEPTDGQILFEGQDIRRLSRHKMMQKRKDLQIIFQDPFSSLDPRKTVMQQIAEPIITNKLLTSKGATEERVLELMNTVGLAERLINTYPHELDGGRRQRIGIARALAVEPKFIICDEPVSALDVSIQAQIINLLKKLQREQNLTFMFITHDLSVVNYFSDDIIVMYLGQIVEKASSEVLFNHQLHPYSQALLSAIPTPDLTQKRERIILKGELTSPIDPPDACRFAKRCIYATEKCHTCSPELKELQPGHFVACHHPL